MTRTSPGFRCNNLVVPLKSHIAGQEWLVVHLEMQRDFGKFKLSDIT